MWRWEPVDRLGRLGRLVVSLLALGACATPVVAAGDPPAPLQILLLDYHEPIEHDVLLSHLCVDRCTAKNGCPPEYLAAGVDYFNADMVVYRPQYLGETGSYVVDRFKDKQLDLVSFSGHHSSGFSGTFDRGRFKTERLLTELPPIEGWQGFFTSPSLVMLQGCWTDVKSGFDKDPLEYIRHVIEDTEVRPGESDRLIAAVNQIAAGKQAYRELFPNACLLGYRGSQIPGGLLEIYGQVHGALRGFAQRAGFPAQGWKIPLDTTKRQDLEALVDRVDGECGRSGWPCNLCRQDLATYRPLSKGLVAFLRAERRRLEANKGRPGKEAQGIERLLETSGYYQNARWSCSSATPDTPPILPKPIDRAPYAALFLDLLTLPNLGKLDPSVRQSLNAEVVLFLGDLRLEDPQREQLRARLEAEPGVSWLPRFFAESLPAISSARQRAFFDFLAEVGCVSCFAALSDAPGDWILRENAASRWRISLGHDLLRRYLGDSVPRVRLAALGRTDPFRDRALLLAASQDPDEKVSRMATQRLFAAAAAWRHLRPAPPALDPTP